MELVRLSQVYPLMKSRRKRARAACSKIYCSTATRRATLSAARIRLMLLVARANKVAAPHLYLERAHHLAISRLSPKICLAFCLSVLPRRISWINARAHSSFASYFSFCFARFADSTDCLPFSNDLSRGGCWVLAKICRRADSTPGLLCRSLRTIVDIAVAND